MPNEISRQRGLSIYFYMLSKRGLGVVMGLLVAAERLGAQTWDDPRVLAMARRATDRRVQQLADSGLTGYQATARGYVTFLAQMGEGLRELPRVVKADELALEVYWRAPNLSKQRIIGRRDTTLLPTDIRYHQDHLGIIQNNFPAIIRLGDGDEVRDVPHPLSTAGLEHYEFALTDSLRITMPGRVIDVYELKVRPRDDALPRVIGAVYLDREGAQVVRMAFGFTRAAYLDKQLEDVFVVIENGVVGGRFWLPRRQEVEIRRTLTWLDYPVRGMIRGRWEIGNYELNTDVPPIVFRGPEIVSVPPAELERYQWPPGRLTDSLPPEVRLTTPLEIKRTMDEVRSLARARSSESRVRLVARGASDFVRFDRNSGVSVGAGASARLIAGFTLAASGRHGLADKRGRGSLTLGWHDAGGNGLAVQVVGDVRDAGDVNERSRLANSFAAQEFGSDFSDFYGYRAAVATLRLSRGQTQAALEFAAERPFDLLVRAQPTRGAFRPSFGVSQRAGNRVALRLQRPTSAAWFGFDWRGRMEASTWSTPLTACVGDPTKCGAATRVSRGVLDVEVGRPFGDARFASRTLAVMAQGESFLRAQDLALFGGPVSAPGYAYHSLAGDQGIAQTLEYQIPVPFPAVHLGRFGKVPARATLAPHWTAVGLRAVPSAMPISRGSMLVGSLDPLRINPTGVYQSVGVGLVVGAELLRLDASRAIPVGRWVFSLDLTRTFWGIL